MFNVVLPIKKEGTRDSPEKKESQRERAESFTRLSQEVGVRFTHIGKVVKVHVSGNPAAARGLLCVQEKPFYT